MPLKAKLKGCDIFAFNFDDDSWSQLKSKPVLMACCASKAVLKKSKLGTHFFSHHRKGDCASEAESAEHLYLKNLICLIALRNNWLVITEQEGETPDGEKWFADVYCEKGNAKLAFEVQWSYQNRDEFIRRQKKYIASGVRAAWLFKLKSNKEYWVDDIPYQFDTPVFGMKMKPRGVENLYIPQFDVALEGFIEGMLQGNLEWSPKNRQRLIAEVIPHYEKCWRCKKETGVILGVSVKNDKNREISFVKFSDEGVPEFILSNGISDQLLRNKIGTLKKRFSKTRGESYLSNGCFHCDAIMGNFFIFESLVEYCGDLPAPVHKFEYIYGAGGPYIRGEWYFNERQSKHIF